MSIESSIPPPPPPPPAPLASHCTLCDSPLEVNQERCQSCGLYQEIGPDKPNPFQNRALWLLIGVMLTVYLAVLGIVAILPAKK